MKKRFTSILIVITMLVLTACQPRRGREEVLFSGIDMSGEPTVITYLTIGDKPTNGMTEKAIDRLNEILVKKLNAKLDIYYVEWEDYLNNYNRTLDEGKIKLDLVGAATDWLDAWPNVLRGNFLPLDEEMISTFAPATYMNVTGAQWDKCAYEGKIYFLPENEYSQWTNHGFIYRGDIAQEAGLSGVDNWKDLTNYLEYVAENRPDMVAWDADGSNTTITLGYLMSQKKYLPIYEVTTYGLWGAYADDKTKIISPYYEGNEFVEFAKLMKEWNEAGVWRSGLNGAGNNSDEFLSGSSSVEQHHTNKFFTELKNSMDIKQPGSDADFFWFGKENGNLTRTSIIHGAMAVYAKSENPEKALMVYDTIRNDETCYRLLRYGIEGVQYVVNDSGMFERPSGYNEARDGIVTNFWWGRRDMFELPEAEFAWDDYYELLDSYERIAVDYPWDGVSFMSTDVEKGLEKIVKVCEEYIPRITYGQYSRDPEAEVAEFRRKLRQAGFEQMTDKLQDILDSY